MPRVFSIFCASLPLGFAVAAAPDIHAAAGTGAPTFECRWASTPPVIDGRGTDAVWQHAAKIDGFSQPWLPGAPAAKEGTQVRLLWDREWIYFLAEMADRDVAFDSREHNGELWKNDAFEFFLKPSEQHTGYYEFEVNPAAAVFDAFFGEPERSRDSAGFRRGEFHVEAKVVVDGTVNDARDRDVGWTVEGRMPWTDFGATGGRPAPGETWRINLARVNGRSPDSELSSAVPLTKAGFHRTAEYARLRFVGPEPLPRSPWQNTALRGSPDGPASFAARRAWPELSAHSLVTFAPAPGGEWAWFIEQENGWDGPMRLRRLRHDGDGREAEALLELDELWYSIAFHPQFAENGFVFIGANGPRASPPRFSRVVRYTVRDGRPDPKSRLVVIEWPSDGHNGAALAFANDGLLFVTSGDGTSQSDLDRVGQDPRSLRAKILRIDVDHPSGRKAYSVPRDNPFIDDARFAPETWAYGLRNPWRLTYDPISGHLWSGENGQDQWEYARLVQRGANYGWSLYEGAHPFHQNQRAGPHPVTFPTIEFSHAEFRSLTGGMVYRGRQFPELTGAYVFGDFNTGRVWAAKHDGTHLAWMRELIDTPFSLTHVTADAAGEIVLVDYGSSVSYLAAKSGGGFYRLERAPPPSGPTAEFPRRLSATGLFAELRQLAPAEGVIPYEVNLPGWHDGAKGQHLLALPAGATIEVRPSKGWQLPNGAALAQTLVLDGRRIETRVLLRQQNDWAGYTYRWNEAQTEAELADKAGADLELAGGRSWRVPSRAECMMCHSREANFVLSLNEAQLNRGDQLARWERLGILSVDSAASERGRRFERGTRGGGGWRQQANQRTAVAASLLPRSPEHLRQLPALGDESASLELRARSYLGVNCAHCHTINGGGNSAMEFDSQLPRERMRAIDEKPQHGDFGVKDARVIAPGAPDRSVLIPRIVMRQPGQMPPVGTRTPDAEGIRVIVEWIASLKE